MAAPDHTVLIRPFFAMDGPLSSLPSCPCVAGTREFTQRSLTPRDGITKGADTLANRLADSETCRHAQHLGWPTEPSRWPFTSACVDGMAGAIHDLRPYPGELGLVPH